MDGICVCRFYNMVCSALFFQRALYTVHCANKMRPRKPSFVITTPFLVNTANRFLYMAIKYATFTETILSDHLWYKHCQVSMINKVMFHRRSVDFKRFRSHSHVLAVRFFVFAIVTSWSWMGLWRHCWRRQWLGRVHSTDWEWNSCMECPIPFRSYFVLFSELFYNPCYERD